MEYVRKRNEGAVRRGNVGGHSMEVTEVSWKCERHNQGKIVVDASRQTPREGERERERETKGGPGNPRVTRRGGKWTGSPNPTAGRPLVRCRLCFFLFFFVFYFYFSARLRLLFELPI
jgi:hypothetical protein